MKRGMAWVSIMVLTLLLMACGLGKQSAVEGKLVDGSGQPIPGVKITASQILPIKGYEQFEAVTKSDGRFRMTGLFPSSQYILRPWSDKWTCETAVYMESAPQGETNVLLDPMEIEEAYSKKDGRLVFDLITGATRFNVYTDGVMTDLKTGLEWMVGPDKVTDYTEAERWVASCDVAGGGWRIPTRQELKSLYHRGLGGLGEHNLDPFFDTTAWYVWAEPCEQSSAWYFNLSQAIAYCASLYNTFNPQVFAVRSRR